MIQGRAEVTQGMANRAIVRGMEEYRTPMSLSILALVFYTVVQIGRPQELFPVLSSLRLGLVAAGLTVLTAFVEGRLRNLGTIFHSREMRCVMVIIALGVLSVPMSVWPGGSLGFMLNTYLKVVFYFVLLQAIVRYQAELRQMLWAFLLSSLILFIAAYLYQTRMLDGLIGGEISFEGAVARLRLTEAYSANELVLVFVCALPFAMLLMRRSTILTPLLQLSAVGFTAIAVVWTGSRTGFVLLGLVGILILIRAKVIGARGAAIYALVAAALVWNIASATYWDRIGAILNPTTEYEETYSGRSQIWKRGLNLVKLRPIFGVGIGNFATADRIINGQRRERSAHNSFLEIWAELGIGGLVALSLLLWTSLKRLRRVRRLYPKEWLGACATAIEVSLIGFIVGSFFLSMAYSQVLYFLVGTALICARVAIPQAATTTTQPGLR